MSSLRDKGYGCVFDPVEIGLTTAKFDKTIGHVWSDRAKCGGLFRKLALLGVHGSKVTVVGIGYFES